MPFLLIIFFILYGYISYTRPKWALFIILAALPSYAARFSIWSIPMTLLEGMILVLFFVWGVKKIIRRNQDAINRVSTNINRILPVALFLLATTISVFVSPDKKSALGIWKAYFIEPILFLIIFVDLFKSKKQHSFNFIAAALSIPALYISIFAIYQKFTGFLVPAEYWQPGYHRVTSFFSYPNAIGLLLAPIVILLFGAALYKNDKIWTLVPPLEKGDRGIYLIKYFYLLTAALSILAIIFAKSEGAIIAIIAGILVFLLLYNKKSRIAAISIILLLSLASATVYFNCGKEWNKLFKETNLFELDNACEKYPPQPPFIKEGSILPLLRKENKGDGSIFPLLNKEGLGDVSCKIYQKLTLQDLSGTLRREMWQETIQMLKTRPITGAGLSGYQEAMKPFHTKDYVEIYLYPHNIILNFLSEIGLLGLLSFIWIILIFFYYNLKLLSSKEQEQKGGALHPAILITAMAVLLIHGIVDVPYFKNDLAILFWLIWGIGIISEKNIPTKTS